MFFQPSLRISPWRWARENVVCRLWRTLELVPRVMNTALGDCMQGYIGRCTEVHRYYTCTLICLIECSHYIIATETTVYLCGVEESGKFTERYDQLIKHLVQLIVGSNRCTHTGKERIEYTT